jgi:hypothetical protein
VHGRQEGNSFGLAQLEGTLHVLGNEGGFYGDPLGVMGIDEAFQAIVYLLEAMGEWVFRTGDDGPELEGPNEVSIPLNQSIAGAEAPRINPQN